MRYWSYFAAKAVAASAVFFGLFLWISSPEPRFFVFAKTRIPHGPFGDDLGFTLAVLVIFLLWTVSLNFIVRDQRHRCRVCLRRLRMPVETGSWSRMLLFGRPRIEYICPYGHGTLKEEELQISGPEDPEWTPHSDDIWEELYASGKESDDRP
jgi:hypothetical protein